MDSNLGLARTSTSATTRSFLSRKLTRRGQEQHDDPKGPLGLTTLYEPEPDQDVVADVVFVHGLDGGSQSTWSKGNSPALFWPREWLPMDDAFQGVRIHSFGYPSALSRQSILNVIDFARSLLAAIKDSPVISGTEEPRLIFVAHSMGGLVVKKAYILAHQEPEFHSVVKRVCSIFFLATPHQGAAIAQTLANIMALVPGSRPFVDDLLPTSGVLQAISEEFPRLCADLQLRSFFETRPTTIATRRILIVDKAAAVMNLPNERRTFLEADHRHVAMYASPNDPSYVAVRNALATVVSSQRETSRSQKEHVAQEDQAALNKYLAVSDAPEDDLMVHEGLLGSCEWLQNKDYFRSWRDTVGSRFLWLRGRPGAGKSVLASRVIQDLRSSGVDCCFFFFKMGDSTKSTANAFLRSIAWQMATLHQSVMAKVKEVMADGKGAATDKIDPNPVWRSLYVSAILKARLSRPQFWVIDAMDECKGGADLMAFLTRIQEQWPLSVLVTSRDPVEPYLSNANRHMDIQSHVISDEDSKRDIALFLRSNMDLHRFHVASRWKSREDMAAHIVENSGGCFLWASLICSELRQVTSEREVEEVLASVPSDMDALYSRILMDMGSARFGKDLAKAFIAWTTYAFRPLDTAEMQEAVEMDVNDKVDSVETAISKCCGSLIYVDAHQKVHLIHATAREFLTRKKAESEFVVTKAEGHRRLAMVCLEYLAQAEKKAARSTRSGADPSGSTASPAAAPPFFARYASMYLFQHLNHVHSTDDEVLIMLSRFLGSPSLLSWVEFVAAHGDLTTVYKAGKTINSLLSRRAQHSPPVGLARGPRRLAMLDQWGDDLIHLVSKFSRWLRSSPRSINIMAAFCPPASAIRKQHAATSRGLSVEGLSASGWDDCLTTITYASGSKPNAIAAGPGFFAVGMREAGGKTIVYDDAIFQEIGVLQHAEPVWRLAFSDSGRYLASAGGKRVRIWSTSGWAELASFRIPSVCIALAFEADDSVLRAATRQNELVEWDVQAERLCQDEPLSWTADLEEAYQFRTPMMAALDPATGLLAVIYRGENLVLWEYAADRIYDVYEKDTGSVSAFGTHKIAEGSTTVRAVAFSRAVDSNRLAATYADGDLVVYDTVSGEATHVVNCANTMRLSASADGRTLAGADSRGNLTLFDFETLRPLYRVQFDTQLLPEALAFTADSQRFVEIRGEACRVWEPSVLLRTDYADDENSDTVSVSTGPQEIDCHTAALANVSAIACCRRTSAVFVGMDDGSVHAYDVSSKPTPQPLFAQKQGYAVQRLAFDEDSSILACADASTQTTARKVARRHAPRQQAAWDVSDAMILTEPLTPSQVVQVLVSGRRGRLLMSTSDAAVLWPVPGRAKSEFVARVPGRGGERWRAHPSQPDHLLYVDETGVSVFSWSRLEAIRVVPLSPPTPFDSLSPLEGSRYFATASRVPEEDGRARILLWDIQDLESPSPAAPLLPANQLANLPSTVETVVGVFGARLVVLTADFWIASVDLSGPAAETFVRHFFLPADWVSPARKPIVGVGRSGEVLFAKRSELAVIKRGLDVTETGERFNPRRGSAQLRPGSLELRLRRG